MIENTILVRNREGRKAVVLAMTFAQPAWVEYAALAGFDAIHLDGEHGAFSPVAVDRMVHAAHAHGLSVTARVPNIDADEINRWLDRGVQGIVAPHIETGRQAQTLADACYFGPAGHRSWGGGRGTDFNDETLLQGRYGGRLQFARFANRNMLVMAQVESQRGYANLDEILAVEGLDAIAFGAFDLGFSLGLHGEGADHPRVAQVLADIERRTRRAGKRLSSDYSVQIDLAAMVLEAGRQFTAQHRDNPFAAQG